MIILDVGIPTSKDFILVQGHRGAQGPVLRDAGFDMDLDGRTAIRPSTRRQQLGRVTGRGMAVRRCRLGTAGRSSPAR